METSETRKTFDFSKEKTQNITLAELEATYKENDVYGRPLGGIYHSDLINGISDKVRGISDLAFGNNATCALKK